jgi:hypothetical protein
VGQYYLGIAGQFDLGDGGEIWFRGLWGNMTYGILGQFGLGTVGQYCLGDGGAIWLRRIGTMWLRKFWVTYGMVGQ